MKLKDLGEFKFIDKIARGIRTSAKTVKGIGDDAAVLRYKRDRYLLFTTDMLVEGVHFHKSSRGYLIGTKAVSVNISDIAAMGGVPRFALISLGAPGSLDLGFVDDLYRGMRRVCRRFKIDLAGGDTVYSDKIVINIALLGEVEGRNLLLRSGAKENDSLFVTGFIGGSLKGRHLNFTPRLEEARFLARNFHIHSMIDISDGLLADLCHLLKESRKGAIIHESDIPISRSAGGFDSAVKDGEDFELIFSIAKTEERRLFERWPFSTRLSKIGEVCKRGRGLWLIRKDSKRERLKAAGYSHF